MPHAIGVAVRAAGRLLGRLGPTPPHPAYTVIVTDNFRIKGCHNEWRMGPFETYQEAAQKASDYQLLIFDEGDFGRPADELFEMWARYGNTMVIEPEPPDGIKRFDTVRFAHVMALVHSTWGSLAETQPQ